MQILPTSRKFSYLDAVCTNNSVPPLISGLPLSYYYTRFSPSTLNLEGCSLENFLSHSNPTLLSLLDNFALTFCAVLAFVLRLSSLSALTRLGSLCFCSLIYPLHPWYVLSVARPIQRSHFRISFHTCSRPSLSFLYLSFPFTFTVPET